MNKKTIMLIGLAATLLFYIPVFIFNQATLMSLTQEDGPYESLGAVLFFLASALFMFIFIKTKNRSAFFLLFALIFFFAAGEEISWGQRIFHFATPDFMEANNAQQEFNIHNLNIIQHETGFGSSLKGILFNFNRLFILSSLTYCILFPLVNKYSDELRNLFMRIKLPIISIWFGILFLLNEVLGKCLEIFEASRLPNCPKIYEIKEAVWALFVLLWAVYFLIESIKKESTPQAV